MFFSCLFYVLTLLFYMYRLTLPLLPCYNNNNNNNKQICIEPYLIWFDVYIHVHIHDGDLVEYTLISIAVVGCPLLSSLLVSSLRVHVSLCLLSAYWVFLYFFIFSWLPKLKKETMRF